MSGNDKNILPVDNKPGGKKHRELLDVSMFPRDDKGNAIVSDDYFDANYKYLPDNTVNGSNTKRAFNGGYVKLLTAEDRRKGGIVRQQNRAKVETFAEAIKRALYSKAKPKTCEELEIDADSSILECIVTAQTMIAGGTTKGSTKAAEFLRDTIGEKPVDKAEINADIITAEERALLEKVNARINGQKPPGTMQGTESIAEDE